MSSSLYNCFSCGNEFTEDMNIEVDYCPYCESYEFEMLELDMSEDEE